MQRAFCPPEGLKFTCQRCSSCCRHDPGYVFLSQRDADAICSCLSLSYDEFVGLYCRWVPAPGGLEVLTLKEKSNYDCIFWGKDGCTVYTGRPLQCSSFPFWSSVVATRDAWAATARDCPGMNTGDMHSREEIERILEEQQSYPHIVRPV